MFDTISFCIGEKTIEINGASFSLGELTTQVLNISNDEFEKMFQLAEAAFETMYKNKTPPAKEEWLTCNDKLLTLEQMICLTKRYGICITALSLNQVSLMMTLKNRLRPMYYIQNAA